MQQKSELPEGWIEASLDDISIKITDGTHHSPPNSPEGDFKYITAKNIKNDGIDLDNLTFVSSEVHNEIYSRCNPEYGDLLLIKDGATTGIVTLNNLTEPFSMLSSVALLKFPNTISNKYIMYYIRSPDFQTNISEKMGGVAITRLTLKKISSMAVALPPLAEQHHIVSAIEALFARLDATNEKLDRMPEILKKFRESVLATACDGRLTESWRTENPDVESAEISLKICEEMTKLQKFKEKKRGTNGLPEIEVPIFPQKWVVRKIKDLHKIGAIVDYQDGNHGELYPRKSDFGDDGVKFITATQVFDNVVNVSEAPLLNYEKAKKLRIGYAKTGDVLLTHNATVGRVAVMPEYDKDVIIGTSVTYYRLNKKFLDHRFVSYAMQSELWQSQLYLVMEQTTRNQVSVKKQAEFYLQVPPLPEQQEIVRRVDALFAFADSIEAKVTAAREKTEKLRQSILAKAFSGELVETEAEIARREGRGYEAAEVLLEKIKEERRKSGKKRK